MWADNLADILRGAGLRVVEINGWKQRGWNGGSYYGGPQLESVRSLITHWTATNPDAAGDYPSLSVILGGNGSTPGPLSQLGLGRSGTWYCIAAGLCNHAGQAIHNDFTNLRSIGIEAEYHPSQGAWPSEQLRSYQVGSAAIVSAYRLPVSQLRGHYEIAAPLGRKTDPNTVPGGMNGFRNQVQSILNGGELNMPTADEIAKAVANFPVMNELDGHTDELNQWLVGNARAIGGLEARLARLEVTVSKIATKLGV